MSNLYDILLNQQEQFIKKVRNLKKEVDNGTLTKEEAMRIATKEVVKKYKFNPNSTDFNEDN